MRIPDISKEMDKLVEQLDEMTGTLGNILYRMKYLQSELKRRPTIDRAPVTSTPMTPALAQQIIDYKRRFPKASYKEISNTFNVNPGRVSEVLRGKRT